MIKQLHTQHTQLFVPKLVWLPIIGDQSACVNALKAVCFTWWLVRPNAIDIIADAASGYHPLGLWQYCRLANAEEGCENVEGQFGAADQAGRLRF